MNAKTAENAALQLTASERSSLRAYLCLWIVGAGFLTFTIHREYLFLNPIIEVFVILPLVLALIWRFDSLAIASFLVVAALQSGYLNPYLEVIRVHQQPQQLTDMVIAGSMVLFLGSQYGLNALLTKRNAKVDIAGIVRLALKKSDFPAVSSETVQSLPEEQPSMIDDLLRLAAFVPLWPVLAFWIWWGIQVVAAAIRSIVFGSLVTRTTFPWTVMLLISTVWVLGLAFAIAGTILFWISRRRMSVQEARLELIDLLWREHRRELDHQASVLAKSNRPARSK